MSDEQRSGDGRGVGGGGCRAIVDVLGPLDDEGKLGRRVTVDEAAPTKSEGA